MTRFQPCFDFGTFIPSLCLLSSVSCSCFVSCNDGFQRDSNLECLEVIHVTALLRHGDRSLAYPYPNDPYYDVSYWPDGLNKLTREGKLQHLYLGKWIRKEYSHLFPEDNKYSEQTLRVVTTNVDRTILSALSNLAGLWPPSEKDRLDPELTWQPIPIEPASRENSVFSVADCKTFKKLNAELDDSEAAELIKAKYSDLINYVEKATGKRYKFWELKNLHGTLSAEEHANLTLPNWANAIYPEPLQSGAAESMALGTLTEHLKRLVGGRFVKETVSNFLNKIMGLPESRNVSMYFAHKTTLVKVMNSLGIFDYKVPRTATSLYFELRKRGYEDFFVTIKHKRTHDSEPVLLAIPGCEKLCPFDDFMNLLNPVMPSDSELEPCNEEYNNS